MALAIAASSAAETPDGSSDADQQRVTFDEHQVVVSVEELHVDGAVSIELIERVLDHHRPGLSPCFAQPDWSGGPDELAVEWTVSGVGNVTDLTVVESDIESSQIEQCVTEKIRGWAFLPMRGMLLRVSGRLEFRFTEPENSSTKTASVPVPTGFDGVQLGDTVPDELDGRHESRSIELQWFDDEVEMAVRSTDDGRVGDIAVYEPVFDPFSGDLESTRNRWEKKLTQAFGPPDERGPDSAWLDDEAPVWRSGEHIGQLGSIGRGDRVLVVFLVRHDDPALPCGPEDDFEKTLQQIQQAAPHADHNDDLAEFFEFPIEDMGRKIVPDPDESDPRQTPFDEWIDIHAYNWSDLTRSPICDPLWRRYSIDLRDAPGRFYFELIDGKWKITEFSTAG